MVGELPDDLGELAVSHSSFDEDRRRSYERLEFLGDAVLGLAVAAELYRRFPDQPEGRLARLKAHVISREACAEVAREAGLDVLLVARARELGADRAEELVASPRVLGALTESVLGAAHVGLGWERACAACVAAFTSRIDYVLTAPIEPKTLVQEQAQRLGRSLEYALVEATGPAHDRSFTFAVLVDGVELGRGTGRSKKEAQGQAALLALGALGWGDAPCT